MDTKKPQKHTIIVLNKKEIDILEMCVIVFANYTKDKTIETTLGDIYEKIQYAKEYFAEYSGNYRLNRYSSDK